jgi:hypothetical protein
MNKKMIFSVLVVILTIVVGYLLLSSPRTTEMTPEDNTPAVAGKLDINAVCNFALTYTTFPDAAAAEKFVAECKEGNHPEVIEAYITQMGLGDGAVI